MNAASAHQAMDYDDDDDDYHGNTYDNRTADPTK